MLLTTIVTFAIILGLLVLVHEAGHFFAARMFGIKADEFGFGLPPRMIGIQKLKTGRWKLIRRKDESQSDATIYSLNWLPLGGFVKIKGENGESQIDKDSFAGRPIWQRSIVLSAGVIMNVVLAFVLLSFAFMIGLPQDVQSLTEAEKSHVKKIDIQIGLVEKGFPAENILRPGDVLNSFDGKKINNITEVQDYVDTHRESINIEFSRGNDIKQAQITPKLLDDQSRAVIGVALSEVAIVKYPFFIAIYKGCISTFNILIAMITQFYNLIKDLIIGNANNVELAGPVGIAVHTSRMIQLGFIYILQFTIILSLNLAILNFIPFPALDGGRFLFLIIEKIRRKAVAVQVENFVHMIGFFLLISLLVFVTYGDIMRWGMDIASVFKKTLGI